MKARQKTVCGLFVVILALAFIAMSFTTCDDGGGDIPVTFISLSANGSSSQTTTQLTLTFSQAISGLTADDISLMIGGKSVNKGTLSGSGPTYTLPIGGFAIAGTLSVEVSKSGYDISGSPKSTSIYYYSGGGSSAITYTVTQTGGVDGVTDTTGIIFTFSASVDSLNLSAGDITVGGTASKGTTALSGTGATRTLAITVNSAGKAMVTIAKTGIEAETKHITVYKAGKIAPILTGITAVYSGTAAIYPTTPLNNLKADLTVMAQYSDGSGYTLSENEYSLTGTLTVGARTVTVSYTEGVTYTTTFTVTVAPAKTLTGITLDTTSVKKDYDQNEQLDLSGLVVTAAYNDSTSVAVTNYTTNPADGATLSTTGAITVTVSYTEGAVTETEAFIVNVTAAHIHEWEWVTTATETTDGTETQRCKDDNSHFGETRTAYATGTAGLEFELINYTAYRVRKGSVTDGEVHIPAYHLNTEADEYLPVTEIGNASDGYYGSVGAFQEISITSITIPAGVTSIGRLAFRSCTSLTSVIFAEDSQLQTIDDGAFVDCIWLTNIKLPASVTSIGHQAFIHTSLTSITIPASVTRIDWATFTNCTNLTSVTIPAGVTSIDNSAFSGCPSLTSITFAAGSQLTTISYSAFISCTSLTSVTIPASVTSIGNSAFSGCIGLTSVTFATGSQLTTIGESAFEGCIGLTSVTFATGSQLTTIGYRAFRGCTGLTGITIPAGVTTIGDWAFRDCTGLTSITIPAGVTTIGDWAFRDCTSLTVVTFEGTIASGSFSASDSFPGDLRTKYLAAGGGPGTYTRSGSGTTAAPYVWTKVN
jgi:hypothetical protein